MLLRPAASSCLTLVPSRAMSILSRRKKALKAVMEARQAKIQVVGDVERTQREAKFEGESVRARVMCTLQCTYLA